MNRLLTNRLPSIIPLQMHLNELKSQMDEEVQKRHSFEHQRQIFMKIQQLESVINGWQWNTAKTFEKQFTD